MFPGSPFIPGNLRLTAFHEAGHAVAAIVKDISFDKVWILGGDPTERTPDGVVLGRVERIINLPGFAGQLADARRNLVQMFAGPISEYWAFGRAICKFDLETQNDAVTCRCVLLYTFCQYSMVNGKADFSESQQKKHQPVMEAEFFAALKEAEQLSQANRENIGKVAEALLEKTELSYEDVVTLCQ